MSNCLKCNHCGAIGAEEAVLGAEGQPPKMYRAKGWAYMMKPTVDSQYFLSDTYFHLCPTCSSYLEVFMGERKSHYLSGETKYAYEAPATQEA